MKLKKFFSILTIFVCVFAVAGIAFAENRVEVKVTSEPVPSGSICSKAGGLSLQFDEGTVLAHGDQIVADLDLNVTLCNSLNIVVAPANNVVYNATTGVFTAGTGWGAGTPLTDSAFTQSSLGVIQVDAGSGVFFHVYGTKGSQRITIDVLGAGGIGQITILDADPQQADYVTLNILDAATNNVGANPPGDKLWANASVWEVSTVAAGPPVLRTYDGAADIQDNTLCINVSSPKFDAAKIELNMDSKFDKFSFIPSNPQVAHISSGVEVKLFDCKAAKADNIPLPTEQASCKPFDYETGTGYCDPKDLNRRVILTRNGNFPDASYQITLSIASPSNVWWGSKAVGYQTMTTASCTTGGTTPLGGTAYNSAGNVLPNFNGAVTACTVSAANQAKRIVTTAAKMFTGVNRTALYIDLPPLIYDNGVKSGDEVKVNITLSEFPCGTIFTGQVSLGTFGCAVGNNTTLIYPYFTPLNSDDGWWDGIAVTNLSGTDGKATFYLYEQNGNQAKMADVPVKANSQYVALLSSVLDKFNKTAGDAELGEQTGYIIVCTDFLADGFAMIANQAGDADGSESMGYIPRFDRAVEICK